MNEKYINKIKLSIENATLFPVVRHALIKRWPFWFIKDKYILDLNMQDRAFRKLKRKYKKTIKEFIKNNKNLQLGNYNKTIWWCWLQGYDQAPELVKSCYRSLRNNLKNYDIVVLTEENIEKYVKIPMYILEKYRKKIIGAAHFSDIIRLEVLSKYGGVWIDSTVFCTDNAMCNLFENSDLFVYQDLNNPNIVASNWLISAKANNKIIALTKKLILEFWKNNNVMYHYYGMHLFFKMATMQYQDDWKKVRVFNNVSPHILVRELDNKFEEERYVEIKKMSSFHKLNYKRNYIDDGKSFYSVLIKKDSEI